MWLLKCERKAGSGHALYRWGQTTKMYAIIGADSMKRGHAFAFAMLAFVFEAICVLGRSAGPVELRLPIPNAAFESVEQRESVERRKSRFA